MNPSSLYLALAQSARAPEAHDQQLLDIDGTALVNLGLFLLTMFVLTQLLWKPYLKVRAARGARIEGYKEEAKRLDADAATRFARVEAQLAAARRTGSLERARVRTAAHAREQVIVAEAQAAAQKTLAAAKMDVEATLAGERAKLSARAELLGHQAAEQVLGRKVAA
jgi:F0F1-type ATP synthase membrane subunit b/b'